MSNLPCRQQFSFPDVRYGTRETAWDLNILLYKGGAGANRRTVALLIADGALGDPLHDRLTLVRKLHEEINYRLSIGGSRDTAFAQFTHLRLFFAWVDKSGRPLTLDTAAETYCAWADCLLQRTKLKTVPAQLVAPTDQRPLSMRSAYSYGACIGALLNAVLERKTNIIETTRLFMPHRRRTAAGIKAEKQNLEHTFRFGHLLQEVCDALTSKTCLHDPFPVKIILASGKEFVRGRGMNVTSYANSESRVQKRYPLVNLRIEAELLMFIGQTSMNLEQAHNLELKHFFYVSHLDGYQVKEHKARRGGIVLFEIFKDYKPHFERYLSWRQHIFENSPRLFPFVRINGTRDDARFQGVRIRALCQELDTAYISPQSLRNTRVNWLLRKSADTNLTVEMAQHTKETLLDVYELPSAQRAMVEVTRFWPSVDPTLKIAQAVAPGGCNSRPIAVKNIPDAAPKPDCVKPAGCLWCENHRDIDSLDYIWGLVSFRLVKLIEVSKLQAPRNPRNLPPAQHAVDRLNEKLRWFESSNAIRRGWVAEAEARISEGTFHPDWIYIITEVGGTA